MTTCILCSGSTSSNLKLAAYDLTPLEVASRLEASNRRLVSGEYARDNRAFLLETGSLLSDVGDVRQLVVGVSQGRPVLLQDVAQVEGGGEEPSQYVRFAAGAAAVVVAAAVILFDPIFQGLALALMAGEVASLLLSRVTVPVIYYMAARRLAAN